MDIAKIIYVSLTMLTAWVFMSIAFPIDTYKHLLGVIASVLITWTQQQDKKIIGIMQPIVKPAWNKNAEASHTINTLHKKKGVPNAMQTSLQTAPNSSHIYKSLQLPKDAYKYRLEMLYS